MKRQGKSIAFFANPAGKHNLKWIKPLAKRHRVIMICTESIPRDTWLTDGEEFPVYPILPALYPHAQPRKRRETVQVLKSLFAKHEVEIAHSMYAYPHAYYPHIMKWPVHLITTRGSDVLVDYNETFFNPLTFRQRLAYYTLRKTFEKAIRSAQAITSTSVRQQEVLREITDPEKLHLVRSGVQVDRLLALSKSYKRTKKAGFRIFSPRAMAPLYQQDKIVEGFQLLCQKYPDQKFELYLIDDRPKTPYAKDIRKLAEHPEIHDKVHFLPLFNQKELVDQYMKADVVIMIPRSDGTPNTALETMILKRPLIMGSLGYDEDLFSSNFIWRTKEESPLEVFNAMDSVLTSPPELVEKRVKAAFEAAFSGGALSSSLERLEDLYHQISEEN